MQVLFFQQDVYKRQVVAHISYQKLIKRGLIGLPLSICLGISFLIFNQNMICLLYTSTYDRARLVVKEMVDLLTLDLVDKNLVTDQVVLTVGYDIKNLSSKTYQGKVSIDRYGRKIPKRCV